MWHEHKDKLISILEYVAIASIIIIGMGYLLGACISCSTALSTVIQTYDESHFK